MTAYIETSLYHQILTHLPIACVDIAIVAHGAVLLVKRGDEPARGAWWVPGGRVIKGEKMAQTAARKAIEEVGFACHVGPIVHTAETIFPDGPNGIPVHSINSCFLMYPVDPQFAVQIDEHHLDHRWVTSVPDNLHPYVQACLLGTGLGR